MSLAIRLFRVALHALPGELRSRHADEIHQSRSFRLRHRSAQRGETVVAAPLVIVFRRGPFVGLDDQPVLEHALNRSIQRARAQPDRAVGASGDILNDRVAMTILVGQRDQDMKGRR